MLVATLALNEPRNRRALTSSNLDTDDNIPL